MPVCPRCRDQELSARQLGRGQLWACPACFGVLLAPAEAERMLDHAGVGPTIGLLGWDTQHDLRCPDCEETMQWRVAMCPGTQFLRCTKHGVWFDYFELARLQPRLPAGLVAHRSDDAAEAAVDLIVTLVPDFAH